MGRSDDVDHPQIGSIRRSNSEFYNYLPLYFLKTRLYRFWSNEFALFYNPENGIDIDGAWIDMNEPSSVSPPPCTSFKTLKHQHPLQFCNLPCTDPFKQASEQNLPPPRTTPPPDPNTPIFNTTTPLQSNPAKRDVLNPQYAINNAAGPLSSKTAPVRPHSLHPSLP
jgi:alpha-glucosidase